MTSVTNTRNTQAFTRDYTVFEKSPVKFLNNFDNSGLVATNCGTKIAV